MDSTAQRVLEESRAFKRRLPELVEAFDGRWVVFFDGEVKGAFDDEEAAYIAAVRMFGVRGGFVIARVSADACDPIPLSASLCFSK